MIIYVSSSYFRGDEQTKDVRLNLFVHVPDVFHIEPDDNIFYDY